MNGLSGKISAMEQFHFLGTNSQFSCNKGSVNAVEKKRGIMSNFNQSKTTKKPKKIKWEDAISHVNKMMYWVNFSRQRFGHDPDYCSYVEKYRIMAIKALGGKP